MEEAAKVLRFYRDWVADCPDELMTIVVQRRVLTCRASRWTWSAGTLSRSRLATQGRSRMANAWCAR